MSIHLSCTLIVSFVCVKTFPIDVNVVVGRRACRQTAGSRLHRHVQELAETQNQSR